MKTTDRLGLTAEEAIARAISISPETAAGIVVGAVVYPVALAIRLQPDMIVVRGDQNVRVPQFGIAPLQHADDVPQTGRNVGDKYVAGAL